MTDDETDKTHSGDRPYKRGDIDPSQINRDDLNWVKCPNCGRWYPDGADHHCANK